MSKKNLASPNPFFFPRFADGQQPQWMQPDFCAVSAAPHWVVFHQDPGTIMLYHFPEGATNNGHFIAFRLDIVQFRMVVDVVLDPKFTALWPQYLYVKHTWFFDDDDAILTLPFSRLLAADSDWNISATLGGLGWVKGGQGMNFSEAISLGIAVAQPVLPMLRELAELISEINQPTPDSTLSK